MSIRILISIPSRPALHTIKLIYSHSEFYSTPIHLQSILEKLCNDVIHLALQVKNFFFKIFFNV